MVCWSLYLIFKAVFAETPRVRARFKDDIPSLDWVRRYIARNQRLRGNFVAAKIVREVSDVCNLQ
jgi:hypothetical protein